ncbi:unnamed protein product [Brassica rapa]|uniref:Uncharacterized protein n=2 Tax=Brassica TaxID=3705 RepID=A0A8D9MHV9_BRACM|nr:unnamed protein product [Brassica napus]CAG7910000.1 unnamed protein product [Brassica rapa]
MSLRRSPAWERGGRRLRLFATDRFPCQRVNVYSAVDRVLWATDVLDETQIGDVLNGTPGMTKLMGS